METKAKKVLALLRGSTKQQDMETQRSNIDFYCLPQNFNLSVVETFVFPGITGSVVHKTPEFQRFLKRLESPEITGVVFSQLDRMMRVKELDAFGKFKIFRTGHKLMYCDLEKPLDVSKHEDVELIANTLIQAEKERQKIKFRTQRAKERLILDAEVNITKLPRGVEHVKDVEKYGAKTKKGFYRYTPYAYEKVAPAFQRVAAGGESLNSIAKSLGFANETSLRATLTNQWWIGVKVRDKKRVVTYDDETGEKRTGPRVAHESPIIHRTNLADNPPEDWTVTPGLFNRVQSLLSKHKETFTEWQSNTGQFLGTGFLVCECGCKLYLKYDARRGKPPVYVCSSYQQKWRNQNKNSQPAKRLAPCNFSRLRAVEVDTAIWKAVLNYFTDVEYLLHAITDAQKTPVAADRQADLIAAQKVLEGLEREKKTILGMLRIDDEDVDVLRKFTEVKRQIADARIRIATVQAQAQPFGTNDAWVITKAIVERFWNSEDWTIEEKRAALAEVVERITITEDCVAIFTVRGGLPLQRQRKLGELPSAFSPEFEKHITPEGIERLKEAERVALQNPGDEAGREHVANLQKLS
jgi:hypothetical protein